jgi:hypothetical protein
MTGIKRMGRVISEVLPLTPTLSPNGGEGEDDLRIWSTHKAGHYQGMRLIVVPNGTLEGSELFQPRHTNR